MTMRYNVDSFDTLALTELLARKLSIPEKDRSPTAVDVIVAIQEELNIRSKNPLDSKNIPPE